MMRNAHFVDNLGVIDKFRKHAFILRKTTANNIILLFVYILFLS